METKHTNGEWTTEVCSNGGLIVCLGDTEDWSSQRIQIANIANAKLIASAPELLEALAKLYNAIDSCIDLTPELLKDCKNAIKKATE